MWSGWLAPIRSQNRSGRAGQHPLRPHLPDHPADVAAQVEGELQPAVGIAEEADVGHADLGGGGPLLGLAQRAHLVARGVVEPAGVAVGDDAVGDLGAGGGPGGDGAGAAEVDVVGVGEDAQRALDVLGGCGGGRRGGHPPEPRSALGDGTTSPASLSGLTTTSTCSIQAVGHGRAGDRHEGPGVRPADDRRARR